MPELDLNNQDVHLVNQVLAYYIENLKKTLPADRLVPYLVLRQKIQDKLNRF